MLKHCDACPQVAADDREDGVASWVDADTDATGNVYRLVQMSIAECHSSWKALKARGAGDTGFWLG